MLLFIRTPRTRTSTCGSVKGDYKQSVNYEISQFTTLQQCCKMRNFTSLLARFLDQNPKHWKKWFAWPGNSLILSAGFSSNIHLFFFFHGQQQFSSNQCPMFILSCYLCLVVVKTDLCVVCPPSSMSIDFVTGNMPCLKHCKTL